MEIYVVRAGDTIWGIARRFGVPLEQLMWDNQLESDIPLMVGQALLVRTGMAQPGRPVISIGYAYPFIQTEVLEETLCYLTDVYVFSYRFDREARLIGPDTPDDRILEEIAARNGSPVLVLSSLDENGSFDRELLSWFLNDSAAQESIIRQVEETVLEKGYRGVDVDFEYAKREDSEKLAAFVAGLRQVINGLGYPVSVTLAPKTYDGQEGSLYEGTDYRLLGEAADQALLMTYEWGYSRGQPMAVAPVNLVRRVVEYAVSRIPREKLLLGIPNYGYDWPLPFQPGETVARTVGNVEAVRLAAETGAEIFFDEVAQAPYFHYRRDGVSHVVWFEDPRSIRAKLQVVSDYGLAGVGYWQILRMFRANWLLLAGTFDIYRRNEGQGATAVFPAV